MALFPITDPTRADDIRMRRRRATWFLAGTGLFVFLLVGHDGNRHSRPSSEDARWMRDAALQARMAAEQGRLAADQGRLEAQQGLLEAEQGLRAAARARAALATGMTVRGEGGWIGRNFPITGPVVIALHCDHPLRIETGGTAGEVMEVTALGRDSDAASALQTLRDDKGTLSGSCGDASISDLKVTVPSGHPVTIVQTGDADIHVGRTTEMLTLDVNGSGDVTLDAVSRLSTIMHGSGDVVVREIDGGPLTAIVAGSGDLKVSAGTIGVLQATVNSSGDVVMTGGDVTTARLNMSGDGGVALPHVSGSLDAQMRGDGDLKITTADLATARVVVAGDGSLSIPDGRIGYLDAVRTGDGTLSIRAQVADGTLSQSGDGSTDIPHATLRMVPAGT